MQPARHTHLAGRIASDLTGANQRPEPPLNIYRECGTPQPQHLSSDEVLLRPPEPAPSKLFFYRREDDLQHAVVPLGADEVFRDLPRVADVRVAQRLLAAAEPGRLAEAEELAAPRGVTGNLTDPKPSTSRLRSAVLAASSTLNAVFASPRNVLASRSRAAVAMACASRIPENAVLLSATL